LRDAFFFKEKIIIEQSSAKGFEIYQGLVGAQKNPAAFFATGFFSHAAFTSGQSAEQLVAGVTRVQVKDVR
jgi:hypothetical protein